MWLSIAVGVLLALVAVIWAASSSNKTPAAATAASRTESLPLVSVMTPTAGAVTSTVTFTGAIYARNDMPISVEGEAGRITAVVVEAGDVVKRGQLMARLDRSVTKAS